MDTKQIHKQLIILELMKQELSQYGTRATARMAEATTPPKKPISVDTGTKTASRMAEAGERGRVGNLGTKWSGTGQTVHSAKAVAVQNKTPYPKSISGRAQSAGQRIERSAIGVAQKLAPTFSRWAGYPKSR